MISDEEVHNYIRKVITSDHIYISKSWLGDFQGLFARYPIKQDDVVCVYTGKVIRTVDAVRMPIQDKDYLMRLGEQTYVDAKPCPHILARFINDCRNPAGYNVRFDKRPEEKVAYVIATRDIEPQEEIFADYGRWYWIGKTSVKLSIRSLMARRKDISLEPVESKS